jgi:hypothetical protein
MTDNTDEKRLDNRVKLRAISNHYLVTVFTIHISTPPLSRNLLWSVFVIGQRVHFSVLVPCKCTVAAFTGVLISP